MIVTGFRFAAAFLAVLLIAGCVTPRNASRPVTRVLFGSCMNTNSHPMLEQVLRMEFDLALMIGDNIYADTTNMAVMRGKYEAMRQSAFWQGLRRKAPVLATWDDHDFGANDAGASYTMREQSQRAFHDFMEEPADSPRRSQKGIYRAQIFGPPGKRLQVIMLDTRYFRSNLATGINNVVPSGGRYIPHPDTNTTMLGEAQWRWLEEQLRAPAELRLIASSIQFISEFSGGEAWANLPHEKRRMLDLLKRTNAQGVFFISGDRHWAELSKLERTNQYPLYELTSSALTQKHPRGTPTPNIYRDLPITYHEANAGLILIDWQNRKPKVAFQLIDQTGGVQFERKFEPFGR